MTEIVFTNEVESLEEEARALTIELCNRFRSLAAIAPMRLDSLKSVQDRCDEVFRIQYKINKLREKLNHLCFWAERLGGSAGNEHVNPGDWFHEDGTNNFYAMHVSGWWVYTSDEQHENARPVVALSGMEPFGVKVWRYSVDEPAGPMSPIAPEVAVKLNTRLEECGCHAPETVSERDAYDHATLKALEAATQPLSAAELSELVGGTAFQVRVSAARLIERGLAAWTGNGSSTRYSVA